MPQVPSRALVRAVGALGALAAAGVICGWPAHAAKQAGRFESVPVPGTDIRLLPESERTMERLVLGLEPKKTKPFMLPETAQWDPRSSDPRVVYLRRQLYWLEFELLHGGVLKAAPDYTRFFMAVPDAVAAPESLGNEESVLKEYLRTRIGWTEAEIARRIRFFRTPSILRFPRDMAEPLGRDAKERLVLAIGTDSDAEYSEPVRRLVAAFPKEFVLKILPDVNTEGGDLALVFLPEGNLGLIVGYHRILRYLKAPDGRPIAAARIEEGRNAFQRAFFGLEVLVLGEEALREPGAASAELIHADMVVNVLRGRTGVVAFVPSYREEPIVDAISQVTLPEDVRKRAQGEYDRAARQLQKRGYRVVRLPFRDHPDRTPVQVGDFVDRRTGQQSLLLGKYPYHFDLPGGHNPQRDLQMSLGRLEDAVEAWRHEPTDSRWEGVVRGIADVWREMDHAAESPNPSFQMQARIYEGEGIRVIPVPLYPTGEGGIHCLLLN
jgi:hypothetical protein